MRFRYFYLAILFIPLIVLVKTPVFSITGFDILSAGKSGAGELIVGGDQTGFTGSPPTAQVPSGSSGGGGGSSGGGGGGISVLNLDKNFFSLEVKKGVNYKERIIVTSKVDYDLTVNVSIELSKNFIFFEGGNFILTPNESKEIIFDIYAPENEKNDIYFGKIHFNTPGRRQSLDFVLDVKDKAPLFDIKTTILSKYVFPGWKVKADVIVLNLGDLKNIDVELEYFIRDFNNKTYAPKKEMFAINDSSEKKIFIETPKDLGEGDYLLFSKVSYKDISANSYDTFFIRSLAYLLWILAAFINILLIILVGGIIIYLNRTKYKRAYNYQYVSNYG